MAEDEEHPGFGHVVVHRVSSSPGKSLFDSEILHQHWMTITVTRASRKRGLNRDWIHPDKQVLEIGLSEAQWAALVSSPNSSGTPCTIMFTEQDGRMDEVPFEPRLAVSQREVKEAAQRMYADALEKLEEVKTKPTKANIRNLEIALRNAKPNVEYTARTLTEHTENTVQKARADIEAMITAHAEKLGLDAAQIVPLELGTGDD